MILSQHKISLVFLLVAIGLIALPHCAHLPAVIMGFFYVLLSWRFIGIWKPAYLPKQVLVFMLMLTGIGLLATQYQGVVGREAGTKLFIVALGLKLLELKSPRDIYLIIYLAFIVGATQFLFQQGPLMAGYTLFVSSVLLATLIALNSQQATLKKALKTASTLLLQALPMTVILFVFFPRFEAPKWKLFEDKEHVTSGLTDSMEPGSISELGLSAELVFRVKFTGPLPPPEQRYWRGPVFTFTDGRTWTASHDLRFGRYLDDPTFNGDGYQYTLLMEPQEKPWVFALDLPSEFPAPLRLSPYYQLMTTDNPGKRAEYKLTSNPEYNTGFLTKTEFKDSTQLPGAPSEKISELVAQLKAGDNGPEYFIQQLLNHFRTEHFHYTLTPPLMEDRPIERFLFETHYGFCSHYAAAFVYLMRVAHIPARVVTGYQGGELNKVGDFLEVRQADAHAWAEVWLDQRGWVRIDPTAAIAPERIDQPINVEQALPNGAISYLPANNAVQNNVNLVQQSVQLWKSVDYTWQRWIINYDNQHQASFLSNFGMANLKGMMNGLSVGIIIVALLMGAWVLRQPPDKVSPVLRSYQRYCKKLRKYHLLKASNEGVKEFGERVMITLPAQTDTVEQITHLFIKLHYGKDATDEDLKRLKRLVAEFRV